MDHLGAGKEWDLDRKKDGLFILPPYGTKQAVVYNGKLEALQSALKYLSRSSEEYVVLSDSNIICNIDYDKILEYHINKKADITVVCKNESDNISSDKKELVVGYDSDCKINDVLIKTNLTKDHSFGLGMFILKRELLIRLIEEGSSYNRYDFNADVIQRKFGDLNIYAYELPGRTLCIDSESSYFKANLLLLDADIRREIFSGNGPIYTKIRDEVPTFYHDNAKTSNSFIADGCKIDGTVENSIIFRGVVIEKGAVIKNSVIMQDTHIGKDVFLNYVITDKDVHIGNGRMLMGAEDYPVVINKESNL